MPKILIIEDDTEISQILSEFLMEHEYDTQCRSNGLHISALLRENNIDLVLLDMMLPYKSGDQILTEIREITGIPVIVISAKETIQTKVDMMRLGADDYITKPFDLEETLARIESVLRRSQRSSTSGQSFQHKQLTVDTGNHRVFLKEQELSLTAKEYGILALLVQFPEKVFSKTNLFQSVWQTEYFSEDNTLNVHISNLRNKIKTVCPKEDYIETVWGIGYRLHSER